MYLFHNFETTKFHFSSKPITWESIAKSQSFLVLNDFKTIKSWCTLHNGKSDRNLIFCLSIFKIVNKSRYSNRRKNEMLSNADTHYTYLFSKWYSWKIINIEKELPPHYFLIKLDFIHNFSYTWRYKTTTRYNNKNEWNVWAEKGQMPNRQSVYFKWNHAYLHQAHYNMFSVGKNPEPKISLAKAAILFSTRSFYVRYFSHAKFQDQLSALLFVSIIPACVYDANYLWSSIKDCRYMPGQR